MTCAPTGGVWGSRESNRKSSGRVPPGARVALGDARPSLWVTQKGGSACDRRRVALGASRASKVLTSRPRAGDIPASQKLLGAPQLVQDRPCQFPAPKQHLPLLTPHLAAYVSVYNHERAENTI